METPHLTYHLVFEQKLTDTRDL